MKGFTSVSLADERSRQDRLAYLESLYQRESALLTALATVSTILVGIITLALQTSGDQLGTGSGATGEGVSLALRVAIAFAPALTWAVFLYLYTQSRTLGAYIRRLELSLREYVVTPDEQKESRFRFVPFPFWGALVSGLNARHRGSRFSPVFRVALGSLGYAIGLFVYSSSIFLAWAVGEHPARIPTLIGVAIILGVEFLWFAATADRHHFDRVLSAAEKTEDERKRRIDPRASTLEMVRLALFPRPASLGKGVWIIWGGLAGLGVAPIGPQIPRLAVDLLLGFIIVEVLINQGRYLVNNMRDKLIDIRSSDRSVRSRLGRLTPVQQTLLALSLVGRTAIAVKLIERASTSSQMSLKWAVVVVVALTIAYEASRERSITGDNGKQTSDDKSCEELEKKARPQPRPGRLSILRSEAVYVLVALGYTLRVGIGFLLTAGDSVAPFAVVVLLVAVTASHYSLALMGWILAAMEGLVPSQSGVGAMYSGSIGKKPHYRRLMESVGLLLPGARLLDDSKCLIARHEQSNYSRWRDYPLSYTAVKGSKGFKRRIFRPAAAGGGLALATLFVMLVVSRSGSPIDMGARILGFLLLAFVAQPWQTRMSAWFGKAEEKQKKSEKDQAMVEARGVEARSQLVKRLKHDSHRKAGERAPLQAGNQNAESGNGGKEPPRSGRDGASYLQVLFVAVLGSLGAFWLYPEGLDSVTLGTARIVDWFGSGPVHSPGLQLLAGASVGLLALFLYRDPRGTALSNLASLRRLTFVAQLMALKAGRVAVAIPTILFFGSATIRARWQESFTLPVGQASRLERLDAALKASGELFWPVDVLMEEPHVMRLWRLGIQSDSVCRERGVENPIIGPAISPQHRRDS